MILNTQGGRAIWMIAAAAGAGAVVAGVSLFGVPSRLEDVEVRPRRVIELRSVTDERTLLSEEASLRDLAPLFLPTDRNATLRRLPAREPGKTFLDIEAPKLGIADTGWRFDADLPEVVTADGKPIAKASPVDYLHESAREGLVTGFGREQARVAPLRAQGPVVEAVRARDGQVVFTQELDVAVRPPTNKLWQPFDFIANVGPAGLVVALMPNTRSGVDEVDNYFRNYLAQSFRIGERLPPGFYRISVTP